MSLIIELIKNRPITKEEIYNELYEICDREHSSCNAGCPVYKVNGDEIPWEEERRENCICFKNGREMYKFIRSKI